MTNTTDKWSQAQILQSFEITNGMTYHIIPNHLYPELCFTSFKWPTSILEGPMCGRLIEVQLYNN